jgi:hypothetical protein
LDNEKWSGSLFYDAKTSLNTLFVFKAVISTLWATKSLFILLIRELPKMYGSPPDDSQEI